jgi:hypothetical protein
LRTTHPNNKEITINLKKRNFNIATRVAISATSVFLGTSAQAAVINFETTPSGGTPTDNAVLGLNDAYVDGNFSITFGFDTNNDSIADNNAYFERIGNDTETGFFNNERKLRDTADSGFESQLGSFFLRQGVSASSTGSSDPGTFVVQYSYADPKILSTGASGEIWDIDVDPNTEGTEQYSITAFDRVGNSFQQFSPEGTDFTLDGRPYEFSFSAITNGIDRIEIDFVGTKDSGIGLAFNNFDSATTTVTVPEPMTILGSAIALGFGGAFRKKFSKKE